MNRRQFIKLSLGSAALITFPISVSAKPIMMGQFELWQDSRGSIPVTRAGQPVGLMRDTTGYGFDLFATSTASAPVYGVTIGPQ